MGKKGSGLSRKSPRIYLEKEDGGFEAVENISTTVHVPTFPETRHRAERRIIFRDDSSHRVQNLGEDFQIHRNAELDTMLIIRKEPLAATWSALKNHIEREEQAALAVKERRAASRMPRAGARALSDADPALPSSA